MMKRSALVMAVLGACLLTGGGVATAGDHLKCYAVKDKTPDNRAQGEAGNNKRPVDLTSSTGMMPETFAAQGCVVDNRKAKFCCDAVDKDGGPPTGSTISNRFCCYKLKCPTKPFPNTSMHVNDQFRNGTVALTKPKYLCAPGL